MLFTSEQLLVLLLGLALLSLLLWLYVRSYRGHQHATDTINIMLFPLLAAATATLSYINSVRQSNLACNQATSTVFFAGVIAAIALLLSGLTRTLILNPHHDRIHLTHAALFIAMVVIVVFLVAYLDGCLLS
jgi:hypothetical protein